MPLLVADRLYACHFICEMHMENMQPFLDEAYLRVPHQRNTRVAHV